MAHRIEAEQAALALAEREYAPDVEVMAAYDTIMGNGPTRDLAPQVGLRLNLPIRREKRSAAVAETLITFADKAADILRFASLGTTEQGESRTRFRVDYLKSSGAIGYYHPDWVVVQKTTKGEVNWIIETKGRVWEGTELKDEAIRLWCARITERTKQQWRFVRINQSAFDAKKPSTLADAVTEIKAQPALI